MARKTIISLLKRTAAKAPTSFPIPINSENSSGSASLSSSALASPKRRSSRSPSLPGGDVYSFKKVLHRAKDGRTPPLQVVDSMFGLGQVLPADVVRKLAIYFADHLSEMVSIMIEDDKTTGSLQRKTSTLRISRRLRKGFSGPSDEDALAARIRHGRSWTVMMFFTQGPPGVRSRLAKREHIDTMVSALKGDDVDEVVAQHLGMVLKKMVAEDPKNVCELLSRSPVFVERVLNNIHVESMADLLPRLISRQGFAIRNNYTFTKPSKKGVAMLGHEDVQRLLSRRFVEAAEEIKRRKHEAIIADYIVEAMSAICVRTMLVTRKDTEPEEKDDDKYVCHLGIITGFTLNESLDKLDLLATPDPIATVLDCALESGEEYLIYPAFKLISSIVATIRDACDATDPTIQADALNINTEGLQRVVFDRWDALLHLLRKGGLKGQKVGRLKLATLGLITDIFKVRVPPRNIKTIEKSGILQELLRMYNHYRRCSILHQAVTTSVVDCFSYSLRNPKLIAKAWIETGNILSFILDMWDSFSDPRVKDIYHKQIVEMICAIRDRLLLDPELKSQITQRDTLERFNELCSGPIRELLKHKPRPLGGRSPSRLDNTIDVAEELATGEDFGLSIHTANLLEDAKHAQDALATATELGILAQINKGQGKSPISNGFSRLRKSFG